MLGTRMTRYCAGCPISVLCYHRGTIWASLRSPPCNSGLSRAYRTPWAIRPVGESLGGCRVPAGVSSDSRQNESTILPEALRPLERRGPSGPWGLWDAGGHGGRDRAGEGGSRRKLILSQLTRPFS